MVSGVQEDDRQMKETIKQQKEESPDNAGRESRLCL